MPAVDPKKSILVSPEGVSAQGVVDDAADACNKALIALPEILSSISDHLSIISLYFFRRGKDEQLFTPEDLKEMGEDDEYPGEMGEDAEDRDR